MTCCDEYNELANYRGFINACAISGSIATFSFCRWGIALRCAWTPARWACFRIECDSQHEARNMYIYSLWQQESEGGECPVVIYIHTSFKQRNNLDLGKILWHLGRQPLILPSVVGSTFGSGRFFMPRCLPSPGWRRTSGCHSTSSHWDSFKKWSISGLPQFWLWTIC